MITKKEIEHIANLARIKLNEKEKEKYAGEISSILDFVADLKEVDTENIIPLYQASGASNVAREDGEPIKPDGKLLGSIINQAPRKNNGFVKVKPVLNKGGK